MAVKLHMLRKIKNAKTIFEVLWIIAWIIPEFGIKYLGKLHVWKAARGGFFKKSKVIPHGICGWYIRKVVTFQNFKMDFLNETKL